MSKTLRFRIISGLVAALALVAAFLILNRSESSAVTQSTDDAYVQADFTVIVPQVAGVITRVDVDENQQVQAGAQLVGIDERDLRIAVSMAEAHINSAQATIASLQAQIDRQQSTIAQARAALAASSASLQLAEINRNRYANLARDGSGTVQARQQADAQQENTEPSSFVEARPQMLTPWRHCCPQLHQRRSTRSPVRRGRGRRATHK